MTEAQKKRRDEGMYKNSLNVHGKKYDEWRAMDASYKAGWDACAEDAKVLVEALERMPCGGCPYRRLDEKTKAQWEEGSDSHPCHENELNACHGRVQYQAIRNWRGGGG